MNLKEHDNNQFTKQSDEVEKYLLRIIQRYFDIENNFTKESIEAMIIESLARFKQMIMREKGFIFSLNQKTGHLNLTIRDFGGETLLEKHTAFNKNFGNQADTICEGNDKRLSDDREPLEHIHVMFDIQKLEEKINNIGTLNEVTHVHGDKSILDMIKYTGTQTQIDLIVLEQLEVTINNYYNNLIFKQDESKDIYDKNMDILVSCKTIIDEELQNIKDIIQNSVPWINEIKTYADEKLISYKNDMLKQLMNFVYIDKIQSVVNLFKTIYFVAKDGEIPIPNGEITCNPITSTMPDGTPWSICFVQERVNLSMPVSGVNNLKAKFYFRYDSDDGEEITIPLPFCIKNGDRNIFIEGSYNKTGITITAKNVKELPYYGTNDNIYLDSVIIKSYDDASYYNVIIKQLEEYDCNLCLIDTTEKQTFVRNLLADGETYFIQGTNFAIEGTDFLDDKGNTMSYFNWDAGQPVYPEISNVIYLNENKKWAIVQDKYNDSHGYILEYEIKKITDLYKNPRIYYQILGNKEVV